MGARGDEWVPWTIIEQWDSQGHQCCIFFVLDSNYCNTCVLWFLVISLLLVYLCFNFGTESLRKVKFTWDVFPSSCLRNNKGTWVSLSSKESLKFWNFQELWWTKVSMWQRKIQEMHKAKYRGRGKRRELQGKRRNGRMPNIIQLKFVCWVEPGISRILFGIILCSLSQ